MFKWDGGLQRGDGGGRQPNSNGESDLEWEHQKEKEFVNASSK